MAVHLKFQPNQNTTTNAQDLGGNLSVLLGELISLGVNESEKGVIGRGQKAHACQNSIRLGLYLRPRDIYSKDTHSKSIKHKIHA